MGIETAAKSSQKLRHDFCVDSPLIDSVRASSDWGNVLAMFMRMRREGAENHGRIQRPSDWES